MADFGASKVRADKSGWYKVLGVYGGSEARAMQCFEFPRECYADTPSFKMKHYGPARLLKDVEGDWDGLLDCICIFGWYSVAWNSVVRSIYWVVCGKKRTSMRKFAVSAMQTKSTWLQE